MTVAGQSRTMRSVGRYFEVMLYLMVLSGFGTLAQTGQLDPISVLLVIGALTIRGYLLVTQKRFILPEQWTNYLTLVFACWYCGDLFWISGTFLAATVHLVLALMVIRLFTARRDRDFVFLAILAFGLVLFASVLTVDSTFLIGFAAFLLTAVATFVLLDMRRSAASATAQAYESEEYSAGQGLGVALGALTPVLMMAILVIAVGIFFMLPRLSAGYLSAYASGGELSSGFSDRVELGKIGQIQLSNSAVMHIQITGDTTGVHSNLLWRGIALNRFDGRSWFNTERQVVVPRSPEGVFLLPGAYQRSSGKIMHYRVLLEPLGSNIFFVASEPRRLQGAYRMVTTDAGGTLYDFDREHPVGLYEGDSELTEVSGGPGLSTKPLAYVGSKTPEQMGILQLPELDPRVTQLAEQIAAKASDNYERASSIEQYLRTHYSYTLDQGRIAPRDPVAYFLFERKQGHCEYFASAMAVMLRSIGIPSRVVNGFRGGDFNDITSQYVIRMRNAHSWVEAYFPDRGWVTFDPTPGNVVESSGRLTRLVLYLDAASSFWREWVINYDFQHQRTVGQEATNSSRQLFERTRIWAQEHYDAMLDQARRWRHRMLVAPRTWTFTAVLAVMMLILVMNAPGLWRLLSARRLAAHPERAPQAAASLWYERMTRTMARRGWRKLPSQTPTEFAESIADAHLHRAVMDFTDSYEKARFAESIEEAERLSRLYEEIESVPRS